MAPSASKQKRLAEKAAKQSVKGNGADASTSTSTPIGSSAPSAIGTPLTSMSANTSTDNVLSMAKLQLATDRCVFCVMHLDDPDKDSRSAAGVLVSDPKSRDIKIDSYTLSFHGRLLFENAEIALNYGQRYGLLGENGSGKVRFFFRLLYSVS
jgi:ATP-binding cassette subfamily F protein 2